RLFVTPEEVSPPSILKNYHEALKSASSRGWANAKDGLNWVLKEPHVRSVHLSLLPPNDSPSDLLTRNHLEGLRLKLRAHGEGALQPEEKRELLWDADSIEALKWA